jgi:hypothetical protein
MAELEYAEVDAQPYRDACFSSGLVHGHPVDEVYLKFEREGEEPTTIVLRRDEAVRVAALLANAVWALLLYPVVEETDHA